MVPHSLGPEPSVPEQAGADSAPQSARMTQEGAKQPNVLFVYLDDFGWRDAGFMGSDFFETPHLDRLAADGMVFRHAYSCAANCAPARASLMSGQYSPRHQIFNVGTGPRGKASHRRLEHVAGVDRLPPDLVTWADCMQSAGYTTATMGKWHLSDDPTEHGFDVQVGGSHAGGPPKGYYPPHRTRSGAPLPGLTEVPAEEYLTDTLTQRAEAFIRDASDRPWALLLSHFAVHTPLQPKRELVAKYRAKSPGELHDHVAMATMIEAVDHGVGRLVALLETLGIADNTVILFTSDNGGYGPATDMAPLRGYKGTYYEGGIRVPMFVHWPGRVVPGSTCDVPVIGVDWYPTLCSIAATTPPAGHVLDGVDLAPLLDGARPPALLERPLFWHFPAYLQSYRGIHDEQQDSLFRSRPCASVRQGAWKYLEWFEPGAEPELYHLLDDPGETQNQCAFKPEVAAMLRERLHRWQAETQAPVPRTLNAKFDAQAHRKALRDR